MALNMHQCCLLLCLLLLSCWLNAPLVNSFRMVSPSSTGYRLQLLPQHKSVGYLTNVENNLISRSLSGSRKSLSSTTSLAFKVSENDVKMQPSIPVALNDGDSDDDNDYYDDEEEDDSAANKVLLLRRLSRGVIPIAASVGFAVTPSVSVVKRIAGAAAGGVAGFIAKRIIDQRLAEAEANLPNEEERLVTIPPSVHNAMAEMRAARLHIASCDLKRIETFAKQSKVRPDDLGLFFVHVLANAVFEAVRQKSMDLTDLTELMDFIDNVGFTASEIADGIALAATMVGSQLKKDEHGFYSTRYPIAVLHQAAKIFFLADKFIGTFEGYYGKRTLVSLTYFLPEDYQELITNSCTKLFLRCVESVLVDPSSFTSVEVDRLKAFITTSPMVSTFRPANMQKVITDAFLTNVDKNLELANATHVEEYIGNMEHYLQAKDVLGWDERELIDTIRTRTQPLFSSSCKATVDKVCEHPDRAAELGDKLRHQMQSLHISSSTGRQQVNEIVHGLNSEYLRQMERVHNASEGVLEPVFRIMVSYTHLHEGLKTFSEHLFGAGDGGIPIPELPFASTVRLNMYQMALESEASGKPAVIDDMFALSPEQKKIVVKTMALPKISSWLQRVIAESQFNGDSKFAYQRMLKQYDVEEVEWNATSLDFYYREVSRVGSLRAIPTLDDMDRLRALREFLDCSDERVRQVHLEVFGDKYVKALEDSMNPTGIVGDDYVNGLERLRLRLGLTMDDVEKLTGVALIGRLQPMVENLCDIFKSNTDINYRREKERKAREEGDDSAAPVASKRDKSLDPISSSDNVFGFMEVEDGSSTVTEKKTYMREVVNLVELVTENFGVQGVDIRAKEMPPINAVDMVNATDLAGMYKHFLISRLSEPNEEFRARYEDIESFYAKLLGLAESDQVRVKESVAYTAFSGLLRHSLQRQNLIERQDIQQFAILKEKLPLSDESAELIYREACVDTAVEQGYALFMENNAGSLTLTPVQARRYREQVQSLGLQLREDLKFSLKLLSFLYSLEVQYMIENDLNDFAEVQESYGLSEDEAMTVVEESCRRYISQQLNLALRSAKRYDEKECVKWTADIMKYANYVTGKIDADGNLFSEDDKKRLISFFVAELEDLPATVEGLPEGETAASYAADKLRDMIHLTTSYKAPVNGIKGILGETKSLQEMLKSSESTAQSKKQWAWG